MSSKSPIWFGPISNGEYPPTAAPHAAQAEELVGELATRHARRLGMDRRAFLAGPLGTAAALFAISKLTGCSTSDENPYDSVTEDLVCDEDAARELLGGDEFILDAQLHHVNPDDADWQSPGWVAFLEYLGAESGCEEPDSLACFSREAFLHEVFVASDTTVGLVSAVPALPEDSPLDNDEMQDTMLLVNELAASQRCVAHAGVFPNVGQDHIDSMSALLERLEIVAWKTYTGFEHGDSSGWFLDDDVGAAFLDNVMACGGPRVVCIHKGLNLGGDATYYSPRDMGPAALAWPEIQLVAYHSGFESSLTEGAFDEADPQGVDRLIATVLEAGFAPDQGNVWAEMGSTWQILMQRPTQAAHYLGKLLKYLGPERILWGTDCIWYGSPQPQIEAFRAFSIPESMQEEFGYPALTQDTKARILGLNAAGLFGVDPDLARCTLSEDSELAARRERWQHYKHLGPRVYGPRDLPSLRRLIGA